MFTTLKTNAFVDYSDLMKIFDKLTEEYTPKYQVPPTNVIEDDNSFTIEVSLAGIKKENIELYTEKGKLYIKAERIKKENAKYNNEQTYFGKYEKIYPIKDTLDINNISAEFVDGILTITIPKDLENVKKVQNKIEIK